MNRETKFRAWYQSKMWYGITKHHVEHHALSGQGGEVWDFADWLKYAKVMEYIGIKDKDDKEIFEGDIVRLGGEYVDHAVVQFLDGMFVFMLQDHPTTLSFFTPIDLQKYEIPVEIVGNIFENPQE